MYVVHVLTQIIISARRSTHGDKQQRNFCRQKCCVCVELHVSF